MKTWYCSDFWNNFPMKNKFRNKNGDPNQKDMVMFFLLSLIWSVEYKQSVQISRYFSIGNDKSMHDSWKWSKWVKIFTSKQQWGYRRVFDFQKRVKIYFIKKNFFLKEKEYFAWKKYFSMLSESDEWFNQQAQPYSSVSARSIQTLTINSFCIRLFERNL